VYRSGGVNSLSAGMGRANTEPGRRRTHSLQHDEYLWIVNALGHADQSQLPDSVNGRLGHTRRKGTRPMLEIKDLSTLMLSNP
jgi:hypothetical protein